MDRTELPLFGPREIPQYTGDRRQLTEDLRTVSRNRLSETIFGVSFPSKMGCPAWGTPIKYCRTGAKLAQKPGTVCESCYADPRQGTFGFPATRAKLERNQEGLFHPLWVPAAIQQISWHARDRFRWMMSGDIQGVNHGKNIIRVCLEPLWIMHWCPTREPQIVLAIKDEMPDNLNVRASGTMIDGPAPFWWPTMSTVVTDGATCLSSVEGGNCASHGCDACWEPLVPNVSYL